jgi:hypothetical protein
MKIRNLFTLCLIAISFCFNTLYAKKVDVSQAKQVAVSFYTERYNAFYHTSLKTASVTETFTINDNANTDFYIFNMSNGGFVMVAANDVVSPVLGYSFQGIYNENNVPVQFVDLMNNYKQQISSDVAAGLSSTPQIEADWKHLSKTSGEIASVKNTLTSSLVTVGPLCSSTWDQSCCYNMFCPYDVTSPSGYCDHVPTGCVATAMAQEMFYYGYPLHGTGSNSYTAGSYGTQSANFGATNYNWNAMTNVCTGTDSAIAKLIYQCGVSVDMDYGPTGSGANMFTCLNSLKNNFNYTTATSANKSSYTQAAWDTLMASELTAKRPMIYSGDDPTEGGHAWICDGYQFNGAIYYFHFNWGWSGSSDGYYLTSLLNPEGMDFSEDNQIIYNVYPPTGYPYYCPGTTTTLTSTVGTFDDGSGPLANYQNSDNCSWLIKPNCISHINLSFDNFSTTTGDVLTIYNGADASAPVLHTYTGIDTGSALPAAISSTSPEVFLTFNTSASGATSSGWKISYTSTIDFCSGNKTLTAPSDTFSNGSGTCNYATNTNCKWTIEPDSATSVTLHFLDFNTIPTTDVVKVTDNAGDLLATYSGSAIPADVTSSTGQMLIEFQTNPTTTAPGWTACYTSTKPSGVEEYNSIKNLAAYPNPVTSMLHVSFNVKGSDQATLNIYSLTGQIVYTQDVNCINGSFSRDIDISSFAKGIYNLRILTSKESVNKKIIVE